MAVDVIVSSNNVTVTTSQKTLVGSPGTFENSDASFSVSVPSGGTTVGADITLTKNDNTTVQAISNIDLDLGVIDPPADATAENTDQSYQQTVASGGTLVIPDINITKNDDSVVTSPAAIDLDLRIIDPSLDLQGNWDAESDANKNTFVDNNNFEIITHIYDSVNASAVIARMTSPVIAEEAAISKFVTLLGANWDLIDDFAHYGVQTETNALTAWKLKTQTATNAPTHTPGTGYAFNGTTQSLNTNYNPVNDAVNYLLDDNFSGVFIVSVPSTVASAACYGSFISTGIFIRDGSQLSVANNAGGVDMSGGGSLSDESLFINSRTDSANMNIIKNGQNPIIKAKASSSITNGDIGIGCNLRPAAAQFFTGTISSFVIGKSISFDHQMYYVQLKRLNADLAAI